MEDIFAGGCRGEAADGKLKSQLDSVSHSDSTIATDDIMLSYPLIWRLRYSEVHDVVVDQVVIISLSFDRFEAEFRSGRRSCSRVVLAK